jgi:hypothetical protein
MKLDGKWTVFSTIFFFRFVDGALQPARNSFLESDESSTVSDGNEEGYFEPADDRPFDNTTASSLYHYLLSDGDIITTAENTRTKSSRLALYHRWSQAMKHQRRWSMW